MEWRVEQDDVLKWAATYKGVKFHALLCDPPYHLTSITKRFGKPGSVPAQYGRDGAFARASAGFMGQVWDGGDVAFRPETWAALGEHLYPGAFGMAFASARGWHRLAVAIEDAGFIIHPSIFLWAYGSGFPKATRLDRRLGKELGIGKGTLSRTWADYRYGLQALKPAAEPIIVFQKPYEGRPLDCITSTGAGALNIEGARIPSAGEIVKINRWSDGSKPFGGGAGHPFEGVDNDAGRWPANLIVDEDCAKRLDAQSGYTDAGGASRYFYNVQNQVDEADPLYYCSKSNRTERDAGLEEQKKNPHPTVKPIQLNKYLALLLLPPAEYAPRRILIPFSGSGSEMIGAGLAGWDDAQGIEITPEYVVLAEKRLEYWLKKAPGAGQMRLI